MWWVILICWQFSCLKFEHCTDCGFKSIWHATGCHLLPWFTLHLSLPIITWNFVSCFMTSVGLHKWESMVCILNSIPFLSWQLVTIRGVPFVPLWSKHKKNIGASSSEVIYVIQHMIIWTYDAALIFVSVDYKNNNRRTRKSL